MDIVDTLHPPEYLNLKMISFDPYMKHLLCFLLVTESRPIDEISTWVQYGESVCWVAGDWNTCCAPEYGPLGNPECWLAAPLSYENCCLEYWRICDAVSDSWDRGTDSLLSAGHCLYESCARGQELLMSLQRLWSAVGFQTEVCKNGAEIQRCGKAKETALEMFERLEIQNKSLAKMDWMDVLDGQLHVNKLDFQFLAILRTWPPHSFSDLLSEINLSTTVMIIGAYLQLLRDRLEEFRDQMIDSIYSTPMTTGCGQICNTTMNQEKLGPLTKQVSCNALLNSMVESTDLPGVSLPHVPPPSIPPSMRSMFTMEGQVLVLSHSSIRHALGFAGGVFPPQEQPDEEWMWTHEAIEDLITRAYEYTLTPGPNSLNRVKTLTDVLADLPELVYQQHWVVWGDSKHFEWWKPWMESLILSFGASTVSSIVPNPSRYQVDSPHPQLQPINLQQAMLEGPFHGIVLMGLSSAGVGRHGDKLSPNEDLQQAAASWCLLRRGGILIAPTMTETDLLRYPLGRVYGPKRWPHLVANFEVLRIYDDVAAVLRKP